MNDVINKLIEIDKHARAMVDEAENYRATVLSNLEQEVAEFKKGYILKAEHRIGIVKEEENKVSGKTIDEATDRIKSLMDNLNKTHDEHHTEWEECLYQRCIGR